ncbi:hypothetical protein D3C80_1684250 [compost metagenome]
MYETTILRQFAGLNLDWIPDETKILNFSRYLDKHEMAVGILQVKNGHLGDRGLTCTKPKWSMQRSFMPRVRGQTRSRNVSNDVLHSRN